MHQREALWLSFHHLASGNAIKVSVGTVNAITGLSKNIPAPDGQQDYLCSKQPWLDGIATEPDVVRQFVAVDIDDGYSIEEQLTGQVCLPMYHPMAMADCVLFRSTATLQFDIFPLVKRVNRFKQGSVEVDDSQSPTALQASVGTTFELDFKYGRA